MYTRKILLYIFYFLFFLFPAKIFSQFRIVGYVSLWKQGIPAVRDSTLKQLTHLNIAFVNPDSLGNLFLPTGIDSLISQAKNANVKVMMSVGGGLFNPYLDSALNKQNRKSFIDKLLQLAADHRFDGIDADIENENLTKNYEAFIIELSAGLKKQGKLLTAALATPTAQLISNAALSKFDFINVMSYDQTGPWRPAEPGPHSTYEKAVSDLFYWNTTRHVPKKKINLGLPFYGYTFGTTHAESFSYRDIIAAFPDKAKQDTIMLAGGTIYYNGLTTIQNKTKLALKNAGGVMIWQILQDATGTQSLLTNINAIIESNVQPSP